VKWCKHSSASYQEIKNMIEQPAKQASNYTWNGICPTWDAAGEVAKALGTGEWGGDRWFKRITQQLLDYRNEFREYGVAMPPRPSSLSLVCAMTNPNAILDWGGSSGWCWDYLQNSAPNNSINSYGVIETEEVVKYMNRAGLHNNSVEYKTINDSINSCDLLYCNSVLQYFGSNAPLMSLIERTTPEYVLLEDLIAMGEEDFYTVQTYYNSGIPYRFLGLAKLLSELLCQGYTEIVRYPYASPILGVIKPFEMGNFPQEKQVRYSLSILLQKAKVK
jgi:putative methyltransferase (TIGR04325 family)